MPKTKAKAALTVKLLLVTLKKVRLLKNNVVLMPEELVANEERVTTLRRYSAALADLGTQLNNAVNANELDEQ